MTLLYMDSFDHYDTGHKDEKWYDAGNSGYIQINSGTGRRGTDSLRITANGAAAYPFADIYYNSTARQTWFVGFAIKFTSWSSSGQSDRHIVFPSFASSQVTRELYLFREWPSGVLAVRRGRYSGGTTIDTGTTELQLNRWYHIDMKYYADDSSGTVDVYLDGVSDISFGPGDTVYSSNQITRVGFGHESYSEFTYIDDLYICDDAGGAPQNTYLWDVKAEYLPPNGAGTSTDFTPSAGSNYQCVDENPPNDDTDYVSETTASDHDTYTYADLLSTSGTVYGTQQMLLARKDDAGVRSIKTVCRSGTTDYPNSNTHTVADSYEYYMDILEEDPDTAAAWTISGVNAAEFGVELEA